MTDDPGIAAEKAALRKAILCELRAMPAEERAARSESICRRVLASAAWKRSERILLFSPLRTEPDISELASRASADEKMVATIPSTVRTESELELAFTPDLILVPGLAFSSDRHRLGRGGGFYDRLLAGRARRACKIGICFRLQVRPAIPHQDHDVLLDAVISD